MKAYPDTSFLCALYRAQSNSEKALAYRESTSEPLRLSRLLVWEFRQSVRFQAFRHSKNPAVGYPMAEAERMLDKLGEHLRTGVAKMVECDFPIVLATGERISKTRTFTGGHRSFDILHVATALTLDAKEFLSFDANQVRLAQAEGLAVPSVLLPV